MKSGLAMEYRYEMRVCRRRAVWFDACMKSQRERRLLSYDAISSSYQVESDRYEDEQAPDVRYFSSFDGARKALAEVEPVVAASLADGRRNTWPETGRMWEYACIRSARVAITARWPGSRRS